MTEVAMESVSRPRQAATWNPGSGGRPRVRWFLANVVHVVWPGAVLLALWASWVEFGDVPPAVAPAPSGVLQFVVDHPVDLARDAAATVGVVGAGMLAGTVVAVMLASVAWFSPVFRGLISGPALITQCLPVAIISPVLARVLGYGTTTIIVITALISFFPVLVFTTTGLRDLPAGAADVFESLGAGRWQRFRRLAVPAAIPRVLVALRMSVVAAVVGAMLAQWIMGTSGLGYRLVTAQAAFRTNEAWAASLVAIALSVSLYLLVATLSRRAQSWFE